MDAFFPFSNTCNCEFCQRNGPLPILGETWYIGKPSRTTPYFYWKIEKNGSSSINHNSRRNFLVNKSPEWSARLETPTGKYSSITLYGRNDFPSLVTKYPDIKTFAIIRDPVERFISVFKMIFTLGGNSWYPDTSNIPNPVVIGDTTYEHTAPVKVREHSGYTFFMTRLGYIPSLQERFDYIVDNFLGLPPHMLVHLFYPIRYCIDEVTFGTVTYFTFDFLSNYLELPIINEASSTEDFSTVVITQNHLDKLLNVYQDDLAKYQSAISVQSIDDVPLEFR